MFSFTEELKRRKELAIKEDNRIHDLKKKQLTQHKSKPEKRRKNKFKKRSSDDVLSGIKELDWTITFSKSTSLRNRVLFDGYDEVFDSRFLYSGCASREGIDIPLFEDGIDYDKDKWDQFVNAVARTNNYRKEQIRLKKEELKTQSKHVKKSKKYKKSKK